MARPPERSPRAHADPDHVGRHRHARLAKVGPDVGPATGSDAGSDAGSDVGSDAGAHAPAALTHGLDQEDGDREGQDAEALGNDTEELGEDTGEPRTNATGAAVVPLFSVPDSLRSVDVAVGGRAVRGLLLVTVVLLLTLGGRWWWVNQQAAGVPVEAVAEVGGMAAGQMATLEAVPPSSPPPSSPPSSTGQAGASAGASEVTEDAAGAAAPGAEGPPVAADLVVHVIGRVHEPGVVQLPAGSRVIDAVRAAGGVTDDADPASLNLARPVMDGEQVWVGAPGEEPPPGWGADVPGAGSGGPVSGLGPAQTGAAGGQGAPGLVVDLNLADQAELEELPGVGPVTAGNILAWRAQHGRFTVIEELMEVSGIGEKTFDQLRPHVTVGG